MCIRYPDEVEGNFPFLGIALGRRETITDGSAYLNWAEREAQELAAKRAGLQAGQGYVPATGLKVEPVHASSQLLVIYRTVWKTAEARAMFYSR